MHALPLMFDVKESLDPLNAILIMVQVIAALLHVIQGYSCRARCSENSSSRNKNLSSSIVFKWQLRVPVISGSIPSYFPAKLSEDKIVATNLGSGDARVSAEFGLWRAGPKLSAVN